MAKTKATPVETETTTEETTKSPRYRLGGAWKNEDKKGNVYLVAPLSPECISTMIEELQKYADTGCKMISYVNGFRELESHPHYVHYLYPFGEKKEK